MSKSRRRATPPACPKRRRVRRPVDGAGGRPRGLTRCQAMSQPPFDDRRRAVLRALCDTVVPSLPRDHDPDGLWARSATSVGVDVAAEQALLALAPAQRDGLLGLLDALDQQRFAGRSQASREQTLLNVSLLGGGAGRGRGRRARVPRPLPRLRDGGPVDGPQRQLGGARLPRPAGGHAAAAAGPRGSPCPTATSSCSRPTRCVVGSGAGGGVIAGAAGRARASTSSCSRRAATSTRRTSTRLELCGLPEPLLARRADADRGPEHDAHGRRRRSAAARRSTGRTACAPGRGCASSGRASRARAASPPAATSTPTSTRSGRASASTTPARTPTAPSSGCRTAPRALGWASQRRHAQRRPASATTRRPPASSASATARAPSGRRCRPTSRTPHDARRADRRAAARADRVLVEGGRAAGVEATWTDRDDRRAPARVEVRAPQVVVAAGALETPALLLRSGIGGPAVGEYLRLHPTRGRRSASTTRTSRPGGARRTPRSSTSSSRRSSDGFGFLLEGTQYAPGLIGSAAPFTTGGRATRTGWRASAPAAPFIGLHPRPRRRPRDASTTPARRSCTTR